MTSCSACGHQSHKWFGRCPECGAWSTATAPGSDSAAVITSLATAASNEESRFTAGIAEIDRVLGGGLVRGEVVLLAGEPGIGKSTLILQMVDAMLGVGLRSLLVSGEESVAQVGLRASRLGLDRERIRVAASTSVEAVIAAARSEEPDLLVVDSVQTLDSAEIDRAAGSVTQVRDCAAALVSYAKGSGTTVVLIGHVTKDGSVAGPKTLEHMVDAVLALEGDRSGGLRLLRASKNRFGSCEETGVFVMGGSGLEPVADPSAMFLADRQIGVPGSTVFPALEGTRTVLLEIQALVTDSNLSQPRRVAIGVDPQRLNVLAAVLANRTQADLARADVFVAAAGGLRVREPAADLATCIALFSAAAGACIDPSLVAIGEVGLGGEVRRVPGVERRLIEANRLGFKKALIPRGELRVPAGIEAVVVTDLANAFVHAVPRRAGALQAVGGSEPRVTLG